MGCLSQRGHEISVGVDFADEAWEETWTLLVEEVAAGTRLVLGIDGVSAGFSLHGSRQAMNAFQACSGTIRELVSEPAGAGDAGPSVLGRYPCAAALSPPALDYLGDWANATGNDPCLLGPDEFAGIFGFPMATGEVRAGEADYEAEALGHIEAYFSAQPASRLFVYQTLLMGPGEADGRWSPATSSAFAERLEMYTAIGGSGEAWGILGEHHVPRFLGWIESALYASSSGTEFPD